MLITNTGIRASRENDRGELHKIGLEVRAHSKDSRGLFPSKRKNSSDFGSKKSNSKLPEPKSKQASHDDSMMIDAEDNNSEDSDNKILELEEAELAAFENEGRDESWATEAEDSFKEDFSNLLSNKPGQKVQFLGVECRERRCIADLSWPSHHEAYIQHKSFMFTSFAQNCAVSSFMPSSASAEEGEFRHKLVFDCRPDL